jgi:hypothetical protein
MKDFLIILAAAVIFSLFSAGCLLLLATLYKLVYRLYELQAESGMVIGGLLLIFIGSAIAKVVDEYLI